MGRHAVKTAQITAVMVTHDVDEALFLSDRVVMMTSGPRAKVGDILPVQFKRPRHKAEVMEHPDYYEKRAYLINFLENCEQKVNPPSVFMGKIRQKELKIATGTV